MENLPFGVLALAAGFGLVALTPIAVRKQRGMVLDKTFVGLVVGGGACFLLGLGGLVITAIVNARTLNGVSGWVALLGLAIFLLTPVAGWVSGRAKRAKKS